jgi:hypothetical protein
VVGQKNIKKKKTFLLVLTIEISSEPHDGVRLKCGEIKDDDLTGDLMEIEICNMLC